MLMYDMHCSLQQTNLFLECEALLAFYIGTDLVIAVNFVRVNIISAIADALGSWDYLHILVFWPFSVCGAPFRY